MIRNVALIPLCLWVVCAIANAQTFPSKPVRFILAFAPGGGADLNARIFVPEVSAGLGQPIIIENRPGGGTSVASEFVAKAAPDGYTLLVNSSAIVIHPILSKNATYDVLRDFSPVSSLSQSSNILAVHPSLPTKNVKELIALARSRPGAMNFASGGSGTTQHLIGELFKLRTNTKMAHIPYKGGASALVAVLSGEVEMTFASLPAISQYLNNKRLRALATTGIKRDSLLPDVPTLKEAGFDELDVLLWFGVLAPARTPRETVNSISNAIRKAANSSEVHKRLISVGAEPMASTPEEFAALLNREFLRWTKVVKTMKVTVE